jgi:Asp-tRNA(Asn)/Glu-tRNA(Gln) amidotransferase C subunit
VHSGNREFSVGTVIQLALTARLDLPAERSEVVRGAIEHFYAVMDKMDDLDVSDVSPAATFTPHWA